MESITPDHNQVPKDSDILTQGRYMGSTYSEVLSQDWTYCNWVVNTSHQESSMTWINRFALYILDKQSQAMDAEEEAQYPEGCDYLGADEEDL